MGWRIQIYFFLCLQLVHFIFICMHFEIILNLNHDDKSLLPTFIWWFVRKTSRLAQIVSRYWIYHDYGEKKSTFLYLLLSLSTANLVPFVIIIYSKSWGLTKTRHARTRELQVPNSGPEISLWREKRTSRWRKEKIHGVQETCGTECPEQQIW